jgi:nicotinate-nucleotide adenylyltransferase
VTGSKPGQGPTESRPLGLFGGRFDPVHRAHIAIAQAVADELNLDEVRWIVTGSPVHKPAVAPTHHRLNMVELALHELGDIRMAVDAREISAASEGKNNYSADTIASIQIEFPERKIIWILGEDQLEHFQTWSRWPWIIERVTLAVCVRPNSDSQAISRVLRDLGADIRWIALSPDKVSSTLIRNQIRSGISDTDLLPSSVYNYISENKLYK